MPSLPFTNLDISNAYKGHDSAKKIMMGHTHIWPGAPVFSFDTSQIGGELNFKVSSDTSYVACTVNDSDIYIFSTNSNIKNTVRATPNNDRYLLSDTAKTIDISLPMYKRRTASISGTGTQKTRYGVDYNNGIIRIKITNPFSEANNFSISLTGKGTQTKSCPGNSIISFEFTALGYGTYTVTINNLTDNQIQSTTVVVNDNSTRIPIQSLTLKLDTVDRTSTGLANTIKVYSLTEQEALDNYTNAYGPKAIITIDLRTIGGEHSSSDFGYKVVQVFFKILHGGTGYPPNSQMGIFIPDVYCHVAVVKSGYYEYRMLKLAILNTDSNGTIVSFSNVPRYLSDPHFVANSTANKNATSMSSVPRISNEYATHSTWGSGFNNNSNNMYFKQSWGYKDARFLRSKDLSTTVPHDWFYTAWIYNGWFSWGESDTYGKTMLSVFRTAVDNNKFIIIGDNNQGIDLIVGNTGQHVFGTQGTWFNNLVFNNTDSEGNLQAVELGNINVNNIKSQYQPHLQLIQSNYIQTTTNKTGNSEVRITNNPKFKSMHGSEITYTYETGTWPAGFDPLLYRQFYPNTIGAAYSLSDFEGLWYHYKTWGAEQGFTHSDDFLAQDYLDLNPDLQAAFGSDPSPRTSAMLHWFSYGIAEGRQGRK